MGFGETLRLIGAYLNPDGKFLAELGLAEKRFWYQDLDRIPDVEFPLTETSKTLEAAWKIHQQLSPFPGELQAEPSAAEQYFVVCLAWELAKRQANNQNKPSEIKRSARAVQNLTIYAEHIKSTISTNNLELFGEIRELALLLTNNLTAEHKLQSTPELEEKLRSCQHKIQTSLT